MLDTIALKQKFWEAMQIHKGRENAIPRDVILGTLQTWPGGEMLGDREMREWAVELNVASCDRGYFLINSQADLEAFEAYLRKKAIPLFERVKAMRAAYPEFAPEAGSQLRLGI